MDTRGSHSSDEMRMSESRKPPHHLPPLDHDGSEPATPVRPGTRESSAPIIKLNARASEDEANAKPGTEISVSPAPKHSEKRVTISPSVFQHKVTEKSNKPKTHFERLSVYYYRQSLAARIRWKTAIQKVILACRVVRHLASVSMAISQKVGYLTASRKRLQSMEDIDYLIALIKHVKTKASTE
ncbi:hypothetical protein BaRGS_00015982, partial [Batillaria attramentaria]